MSERSASGTTGIHRMERAGEGPATGRAEQRTAPRYEVSLPMRFTVDGETFHEGVCTSISSGGVFVQAELLPAMKASVWLDVALGAGGERLRCSGSVVNLNRRYGAEVIYGFGVRLADRPADLVDRVERLRAAYPGPVRLDGLGFVVWPLYGGSDRNLDDNAVAGLQVWNGSRWIDGGPATHAVAPGTKGVVLGRPIEQYLRAIRALAPHAQALREELVPFGYYGKFLTPQEGVPRRVLTEAFGARTSELDPWLRALAVQMRLIDDLASAAWRLENVGSEQLRTLAEAAPILASVRDELTAAADSSADEESAASAGQAVRGLEALERFVERVTWAARTVVPPAETPRAFQEWKATRRTNAIRRRARGEGGEAALVPGVELVTVPKRQLLLAIGLMVLILGTLGVMIVRIQSLPSFNPTEPPHVLAKEELNRHLPLVKVIVLGKKVVGVVPDAWVEHPQDERRRAFAGFCEAVSNRGFVQAELKTGDGQEVASWDNGEMRFQR
ncbi:MAG: PilZ domain-containing protein [bacterium]